MKCISSCYKDVPKADLVQFVYDIKAWIQPHLLDLHNHSHPHIFRFVRGLSGSPVMFYKDWCDSKEWQPSSEGIQLFKVYYV